MSTNPKPFFTREQYLELEATAEYKHEYANGEIFAMSGASRRHVTINDSLTVLLRTQLRGKQFRPYSSNLRLWIPPSDLYTYPDLMVVCGDEQLGPGDPDSIVNPTVIFEVLSPSTESYDRGKKFHHYLQVPSLQDYVLIAHDEVQVEHYIIKAPQCATYRSLTDLNDTLDLVSINCSLPLREIYEGIQLAS